VNNKPPEEDWQQGLSTVPKNAVPTSHGGPPVPNDQAAYNQVARELMQSDKPLPEAAAKKKHHGVLIVFLLLLLLGAFAAGYVFLSQS
jgi:hypothetical protein